jgi:eukaryotic-like serine/threonine-protein kinase
MIGKALAHYEIMSQLGKGGMGEVYRAKDHKLGREVAIKVLPEEFAKDADRVARFQREAKLLASLNHTNIAAIYGLEEDKGTNFLILELVEGQTLADQIKAGPIDVEESLKLALQIAEALEAAHEKGIIHRDLKPANIKVTPDGKVKVLDFGLAKAFAGEPADLNLSNSPTLTHSPTLSDVATQQGVILGTAAYMSPEQARGKAVDKRADIWAFGVLLYEMVTGKQLFEGRGISETLAAVLRDSPNWDDLTNIPSPLVNLLRRCLQKDISKRLQHIGDARIELEDCLEALARGQSSVVQAIHMPTLKRQGRLSWIVSGLSLLAVVILAILLATSVPTNDAPTIRFAIEPPEMPNPYSIAQSPDGLKLAFAAMSTDGSKTRIFVRSFGSLALRELPDTDGAVNPFWSHDSRFIAFFAEGKLKKVDWNGGKVQTLCDAAANAGGTWNQDDVIVFGNNSVLNRVLAAGGTASVVTELNREAQDVALFWPHFLPDGKHFLYFVLSAQDKSAIYAGSLDSRGRTLVTTAFSMPLYATSGHLLFVRNRTLMAQGFDPASLKTKGDSVPVSENVIVNPSSGQIAASVSTNGVLAFRGGNQFEADLAWFERSGKPLATISTSKSFENPELSPDMKRLAVDIEDPKNGNRDLWLMDIKGGGLTRLTFEASAEAIPLWSPDGSQIAFWSNRKGGNIYKIQADGGGEEQLLDTDSAPQSWTPEGNAILYRAGSPAGLWLLPLTGERKPKLYLQTHYWIRQARLSPNGRWVAYASDEPGTFQVFIQSFPNPDVKRQISTAGGMQPRWRADSKELFYVAADGRLMSVSMTTSAGPIADVAKPLFDTPLNGTTYQNAVYHQYDVNADGSRFLLRIPRKNLTPVPITVVTNWTGEIR